MFNFLKKDAGPEELTAPTKEQLDRNEGCGKVCKNYVGGVAISYIERVELGTDYEIDNLLASKIKKST